jgi:hypothetical protein
MRRTGRKHTIIQDNLRDEKIEERFERVKESFFFAGERKRERENANWKEKVKRFFRKFL